MSTTAQGEAKVYTYIAAFSAVLYSVLLVAPVVASLLGAQFGLSAGQIGLVSSVELGCFSLATLPAYLWLRRANLRWVTLGCTAVVVLGNLASAAAGSYGALLALRAVTALAAGSITVIILSLSAKTSNPSRSYGVFVVCQLAMGAVILFLFPALYAGRPVSAVYLTLAVLAACCLPVAWCIRGDELRGGAERAVVVRKNVLGFVCALVAVLGFYVALGGVWTFMAQIAVGGGTELGRASTMIAVATVFGVCSSLLSTIVGEHPWAPVFVLVGFALMALSMLLLFGGPGLLRFVVAAVLFKIAWSWLLPFLLSSVSRVGGPQVMNSTNLMIGGGLAIGPLLAGLLIDATGGFSVMLVVSLLVLALAVVCSAVVMRTQGAAVQAAHEAAGVR